MALSIHNDIDLFRKKSLEDSILRELYVLEDKCTDETMVARQHDLQTLLDEINEKSKTKADSKQELNDMFDTIEKQMHMQPWNKLQDAYKIEKIKEFAAATNLPDIIREKLIQLTEEKYLSTTTYVKYNQLERRIDSISLILTNKDGTVSIDEDKIKKIIKNAISSKIYKKPVSKSTTSSGKTQSRK